MPEKNAESLSTPNDHLLDPVASLGQVVLQHSGETQLGPHWALELNYMSLGYKESESAAAQGISFLGAKSKRRRAKEALGTRTRYDTIVEAIQDGYVLFEPQKASLYPKLTPIEERISYLLARGWLTPAIAERYDVSVNTVDRHYEEIRIKLEVRNMAHAMRRLFEIGILKVGEEVPDPVELDNRLTISIDDKEFKPQEVGIVHPGELELLEVIGKINSSSFTSEDILALDFYLGTSIAGRKSAIGDFMARISKKLEDAVGKAVINRQIVKARNSTKYLYTIKTALTIRGLHDSYLIPAFEEQGRTSSYTRKAREPRIVHPAPAKELSPPTTAKETEQEAKTNIPEKIPPERLPDIDEKLLKKLKARDAQEVLENEGIKYAVDCIAMAGLLEAHSQKLLVALRFGAASVYARSGIAVSRGGRYVNLEEIMRYVPLYQGLDVGSTSPIAGLTHYGVLKAEREFIKKFNQQYPALNDLLPSLDSQIQALEEEIS